MPKPADMLTGVPRQRICKVDKCMGRLLSKQCRKHQVCRGCRTAAVVFLQGKASRWCHRREHFNQLSAFKGEKSTCGQCQAKIKSVKLKATTADKAPVRAVAVEEVPLEDDTCSEKQGSVASALPQATVKQTQWNTVPLWDARACQEPLNTPLKVGVPETTRIVQEEPHMDTATSVFRLPVDACLQQHFHPHLVPATTPASPGQSPAGYNTHTGMCNEKATPCHYDQQCEIPAALLRLQSSTVTTGASDFWTPHQTASPMRRNSLQTQSSADVHSIVPSLLVNQLYAADTPWQGSSTPVLHVQPSYQGSQLQTRSWLQQCQPASTSSPAHAADSVYKEWQMMFISQKLAYCHPWELPQDLYMRLIQVVYFYEPESLDKFLLHYILAEQAAAVGHPHSLV